MLKRFLRVLPLALLLALLALSAVGCSTEEKDTVTILYTNDVHAYIDNDAGGTADGLTYATLSQLKNDLAEKGENVLLVDAGDHIQGSVYGAMDEGATVLSLMNGLYDLATIGNHEFDYGVSRMLSLTESADFPYISCNFVETATGKTVLPAYEILSAGNCKIAFVGITTPETIQNTAPVYFQDENGNFLYDVLEGEALYRAVEDAVRRAEAEGADYVIALAHLGVEEASTYSAYTVIQNTSGLDAMIDGHSHTEMEKETVKDKNGKDVLLTQTGCYLNAIGKMTISPDGIDTVLIKSYEGAREEIKNEWVSSVDALLGETIGTLYTPLVTHDEEGKRLVRVTETNLGNFTADGYYYYINEADGVGCDIAFVNGGGLRAAVEAGSISYKDMKSVNPFGNVLCVVSLTGQDILNALEWGSRDTTGVAGENENGAFLHAAGLIYTVDTTVPSTVEADSNEMFLGAPTGAYRVKDVKVYDKATKTYLPLDLAKTYRVGGANFTIRQGGDGFTMLNGALVKDYIAEDYLALSSYVKAFRDTTGDGIADLLTENSPLYAYTGFGLQYENKYGADRITVIK